MGTKKGFVAEQKLQDSSYMLAVPCYSVSIIVIRFHILAKSGQKSRRQNNTSREIDNIILGSITEEVINSFEFLILKWTHCVFGSVADLDKLGHSQPKCFPVKSINRLIFACFRV